jgi:hypothetical protein
MKLKEEIYNKEQLRIKEYGLKEKLLLDNQLKSSFIYLKEML